MTDDFKQDILQQIDSLENGIDDLNREIAQDSNMSVKKWLYYDTLISKLYAMLQHLREDIYFT